MSAATEIHQRERFHARRACADHCQACFADQDKSLLHSNCEDHLRLLHAVDCFPGQGGLYDGPAARGAVERYSKFLHMLLHTSLAPVTSLQHSTLALPGQAVAVCVAQAHVLQKMLFMQVSNSVDAVFDSSKTGES